MWKDRVGFKPAKLFPKRKVGSLYLFLYVYVNTYIICIYKIYGISGELGDREGVGKVKG